jgi:hypothetical protein
MAKKYNASMFDKIKDALKKTERTSGGSFSNIMKFPAGHTYTIRLIPDVEGIENEDDKTFFHHYVNSWTSKKDGSFVSAISLKSFGERDPINEARWKLYKEWKDAGPAKDEKFENPIKEREGWLVKAYWIDNPFNSELNGQVQILNMGPQLKEIVDDAMSGNRADEFGAAIFDLSNDGCDFKIVADEQGIYTTYKKSYFTSKTKLNLDDDEIDEIYNNPLDLSQLYPVKTFEELQNLLDEHFYTEGDDVSVKTEKKSPKRKLRKRLSRKIPMMTFQCSMIPTSLIQMLTIYWLN